MISFDPKTLDAEEVGEYQWQSLTMRKKPLSAEDLLAFATADMEDGDSSRHLVNALSNAKKALHMRLEDVCLGFGCVDLKKLKTFPLLISYARNCGVVAPRVLERLNKRRNAVEHDFDVPTKEDVENFVDVVELFLAATDRWEWRMPVDVEYGGRTPASSNGEVLRAIAVNWSKGLVRLRFKKPKSNYSDPSEYVEYKSPSEEFFECVRFVVANNS